MIENPVQSISSSVVGMIDYKGYCLESLKNSEETTHSELDHAFKAWSLSHYRCPFRNK